ncbi:hypothetical protein NicSoilB8_34820 [Arthrobacter sp. NicSoilB8]|nr:hypothetical protein NicSoilB8_34820 [Arthrobacter sp. NicSoilB8]
MNDDAGHATENLQQLFVFFRVRKDMDPQRSRDGRPDSVQIPLERVRSIDSKLCPRGAGNNGNLKRGSRSLRPKQAVGQSKDGSPKNTSQHCFPWEQPQQAGRCGEFQPEHPARGNQFPYPCTNRLRNMKTGRMFIPPESAFEPQF